MPITAGTPSIAEKRLAFRELHQRGCFIIPNPWDVGSALYLQSLGFKALATTSSGLAWSHGRADNGISRDMALVHMRELVQATSIPVNADFEDGFATDASTVAANVSMAMETGVAGLSIEDSTFKPEQPLYAVSAAAERIAAARGAIDAAGGGALLVGRTECLLSARAPMQECLERLRAYSLAGADCLFAPGLTSRKDIAMAVAAIAPKPLNLLIGRSSPATLEQIAALGVRRISVGGALAGCAWNALSRAATRMAVEGRFDALDEVSFAPGLNTLFAGASDAERLSNLAEG